MAENVREVLRAAQSAELQGDKERAVALLQRAAQLYERAGSLGRAVHMLRHALRLDPQCKPAAEYLERLESRPELVLLQEIRAGQEADHLPDPSLPAPDEDPERAVWVIEESEQVSMANVDQLIRQAERVITARAALDTASRKARRLLGHAGRPPGLVPTFSLRERTGKDPAESAPTEPPAPGVSLPAPEPVAVPASAPLEAAAPESNPPEQGGERGQRFIDRGPTLADPALGAWCSFCCRPTTEVGSLVAGPAGAFICATCVGESSSLLGGVAPRPVAERPRPQATLELVGQAAARALLERGLQAGVQRVLLVGPEGCGKSTWLQALAEEGRGVLMGPSALESAPLGTALLVEDVDRLSAEEQASLAAFLARQGTRTVLMTARGEPLRMGRVLRSESARLPLATTAALAEAVRGALPVALLEQVQLLVALERPSTQELVEVARRRLAMRGEAGTPPEQVLESLAAEAARSPRAGHELQALLARVPAGTWSLEEGEESTP
jgi:hypothetical protein